MFCFFIWVCVRSVKVYRAVQLRIVHFSAGMFHFNKIGVKNFIYILIHTHRHTHIPRSPEFERNKLQAKGRGSTENPTCLSTPTAWGSQEAFWMCWEEARARHPRLSWGAVAGPSLL